MGSKRWRTINESFCSKQRRCGRQRVVALALANPLIRDRQKDVVMTLDELVVHVRRGEISPQDLISVLEKFVTAAEPPGRRRLQEALAWAKEIKRAEQSEDRTCEIWRFVLADLTQACIILRAHSGSLDVAFRRAPKGRSSTPLRDRGGASVQIHDEAFAGSRRGQEEARTSDDNSDSDASPIEQDQCRDREMR